MKIIKNNLWIVLLMVNGVYASAEEMDQRQKLQIKQMHELDNDIFGQALQETVSENGSLAVKDLFCCEEKKQYLKSFLGEIISYLQSGYTVSAIKDSGIKITKELRKTFSVRTKEDLNLTKIDFHSLYLIARTLLFYEKNYNKEANKKCNPDKGYKKANLVRFLYYQK